MKIVRNRNNRVAYIKMGRIDIAYRGFKFSSYAVYFSLKPLLIGGIKLYRLGPLAVFVKPRS